LRVKGCYHFDSMEVVMPDILVRNVNPSVVNKLKRMAAKRERSLQVEVLSILGEAANRPESLSALETARKIRSSVKGNQTDSATLLREDRSR